MNIECLKTKNSFFDVECKKISDTSVPKSAQGIISCKNDKEYIFINRDLVVSFSFQDAEYKTQIADLLMRGYVNVAKVISVKNELFTLAVLFFPTSRQMGKLQIIITEHVRSILMTKRLLNSNMQVFDALTDNFCFDNGRDDSFVFSTGKSDDLMSDEEEDTAKETDDNLTKEGKQDPEEQGSVDGTMRIYGHRFDLLIRLESIGEQTRVIAYKVVFQKHYNGILQQMGLGKLSFSDEKSYVAESVRRILRETPNYLTSWDEYAKKEGEFLLAKAKSVGMINCSPSVNATSADGSIIMTVSDLVENDSRFDALSPGDSLEMTDDQPIFLNEDVTWDSYKNWLNQQKINDAEEKKAVKKAGKIWEPPKKFLFKVKNLPTEHSKFLVLEPLSANIKFPPHNVRFVYSMRGDEIQISRREEARRRIATGTAAMPNLGLILGSDKDASAYGVRESSGRRHIEPLSTLVREKVFENPPTDHQIKAIDIALNTPDIAIIQGPPGTGKTTVVTAVLERLNEISDKNNSMAGSVLVTSLQHDAVNNIIDRIRINSLPTIKFGRRGMEMTETLDESVQRWCLETVGRLEAKHDFLAETAEMQECFRLFHVYNMAPGQSRAVEFLLHAKTLANQDIAQRIDEILEEIKVDTGSEQGNNLLRMIYRLRTTAEGFADDGKDSAMALYYELEELFGKNVKDWQKKILEVLRQTISNPISDASLTDLVALRRDLLDRYKMKPVYETAEPRKDIIAVYNSLRASLRHPEETKREIIYNLHAELKEGTPEIKRALSAYTFAFAATAQQSDSREIKFAKGVPDYRDLTSHASYDTVIVDEAARVAPGDLMIPLSQGERRIIMVGDQKQLPHIYDEEIFEKLREEGKITSEDDIQISMFQHLWQTAKELEKRDGIKRTITLDKQYRSHPLLGNFVSQNFYERDGQGFSSPRKAEDFAQPISPHACIWIDVPASKGLYKRLPNGSRQRDVEADCIVVKLTEYLARPDCEGLSFGVITFYSAQRELIKAKFNREKNNFAERVVRIGTVDEFQGMEFDIIFLSVVRSGGSFNAEDLEKLRSADAGQEKIQKEMTKKYYGFLNDNRLCVALSRQKKLLIVVGDGAMFSGRVATPFAKRLVPAMYNLYALCEGEGSIVDG